MIKFRTLSRAAAILLVCIMVFSLFTACGKQDKEPKATAEPTAEPTPEPTPEPKTAIIGSWETNYNIADILNDRLNEEAGEMFGELSLSDTYLKIIYTFNEDGTYEMAPDEESYKAAMKQIADELVPMLKDYIIAMFSAFAGDGIELSEEDILAALEIDSWDEFGEQLLEQMGSEDEELSVKGKYTVEGTKLRLNSDENAEVNESSPVYVISIDGRKLTFESVSGSVSEGITAEMLPVVFDRVG